MIEKLLGTEVANKINEFIKNAPSAASSPEGTVYEKDNEKLTISTSKGLYITYEYTNTLEDEFKSYVHSIDDEIFLKVCDRYAQLFGDTALTQLAEEIKFPTEKTVLKVTNFKNLVKYIVKNHIDELINKYGIE